MRGVLKEIAMATGQDINMLRSQAMRNAIRVYHEVKKALGDEGIRLPRPVLAFVYSMAFQNLYELAAKEKRIPSPKEVLNYILEKHPQFLDAVKAMIEFVQTHPIPAKEGKIVGRKILAELEAQAKAQPQEMVAVPA